MSNLTSGIARLTTRVKAVRVFPTFVPSLIALSNAFSLAIRMRDVPWIPQFKCSLYAGMQNLPVNIFHLGCCLHVLTSLRVISFRATAMMVLLPLHHSFLMLLSMDRASLGNVYFDSSAIVGSDSSNQLELVIFTIGEGANN